MNYINPYHFLNPHLHNDNSVVKLHNLQNIYTVLRKPPVICKYKSDVIANLKKNCLFTDLVFENHVVYYSKHMCVVEPVSCKGDIVVIVADTTWGEQYYHFITEVLPSVLYLWNNNHIYPIVTHDNTFIEPIFRFFGVNEILLDKIPENTKKIIKQPYIECGNPSPEKIGLIRDKLKKTVIFEKKIGIFIVRKENYRNVMNSDDVLDVLQTHYKDIEWHIFYMMNIQETISLFSKAAIIVAPHGAGLTNMVFSPNEITVIEFMDIDSPNVCYWHLSEMLHNTYFMIPCKTVNGNFFLDLKELSELLPKNI